jgi:hypothetical protein
MDENGLLGSSHVSGNLTAWQTFFNDVQGMHTQAAASINAPDDYWAVVAVSSVGGTATQVSHLAMDDEYGSQRRRQNGRPTQKTVVSIDS